METPNCTEDGIKILTQFHHYDDGLCIRISALFVLLQLILPQSGKIARVLVHSWQSGNL